MRRTPFPTMCLTVVALMSACAVEGDEVARSATEQPIIGGRGSETDDAVGAILNGTRQSCSATLIAPTVALTAAHCLPPHTPVAVGDMRVFFGQNLEFEGDPIGVLNATPHPLWTPGVRAYDIGLIRLARPVQIPPAQLSSSPLSVQQIGSPARIVGFGIHTRNGEIHEFRRSGMATVDSVMPFSVRLVPDEAITCAGDSGGPMMLTRDGVEFVAAVHSRSDCETRSIEERVDIHMESFIEPYLEAAGKCGLNWSCDLPCTAANDCEIDCDRRGDCEPPRSDGGCAIGGPGRRGDCPASLVIIAALGLLRRRRPD